VWQKFLNSSKGYILENLIRVKRVKDAPLFLSKVSIAAVLYSILMSLKIFATQPLVGALQTILSSFPRAELLSSGNQPLRLLEWSEEEFEFDSLHS
jgi:hypothetical protein